MFRFLAYVIPLWLLITHNAFGQTIGGEDCVYPNNDVTQWGWDESARDSCPPLRFEVSNCVDTPPFDDDWGWNGTDSCRLSEGGGPVAGVCIDSDGDGYGWNGVETCDPSGGNEEPVVCIDADGDGYGWDGEETCDPSGDNTRQITINFMSLNNLPDIRTQPIAPLPTTEPTVKTFEDNTEGNKVAELVYSDSSIVTIYQDPETKYLNEISHVDPNGSEARTFFNSVQKPVRTSYDDGAGVEYFWDQKTLIGIVLTDATGAQFGFTYKAGTFTETTDLGFSFKGYPLQSPLNVAEKGLVTCEVEDKFDEMCEGLGLWQFASIGTCVVLVGGVAVATGGVAAPMLYTCGAVGAGAIAVNTVCNLEGVVKCDPNDRDNDGIPNNPPEDPCPDDPSNTCADRCEGLGFPPIKVRSYILSPMPTVELTETGVISQSWSQPLQENGDSPLSFNLNGETSINGRSAMVDMKLESTAGPGFSFFEVVYEIQIQVLDNYQYDVTWNQSLALSATDGNETANRTRRGTNNLTIINSHNEAENRLTESVVAPFNTGQSVSEQFEHSDTHSGTAQNRANCGYTSVFSIKDRHYHKSWNLGPASMASQTTNSSVTVSATPR